MTVEVADRIFQKELSTKVKLDVALMDSFTPYSDTLNYYRSVKKIAAQLAPQVIAAAQAGTSDTQVTKGKLLRRRATYAPIVYTELHRQLNESHDAAFTVWALSSRPNVAKENIIQLSEFDGGPVEPATDLAHDDAYVQIWPPTEDTAWDYNSIAI